MDSKKQKGKNNALQYKLKNLWDDFKNLMYLDHETLIYY